MITHNLKSIVLLAVVLVIASACNPSKLIERGRFDDAIELSARKLSGKKKKKIKFVKAMEESFHRATQRDMRRAKELEKERRDENWVEINRIYQRIQKRQDLIEPLLPLYAEDGYKADFKFVRVGSLLSESKKKAAEFYYNEGRKLLRQAESGDKLAARDAYRMFEKINKYYGSYKDRNALMDMAHELGTVYILFKMENQSGAILPRNFEREIKRISVRDMEDQWREFHLNPKSGLNYDYQVVMKLRNIDVSPDLVKEREYVDDKEIEDGWEYVLDENGNVMKDTAGNDIKIPRRIFIKASVFESYQSKTAVVTADLEFHDLYRRELIHTELVTAEAIFENYAATFRGDRRALSNESKRKIGNQPLPFPTSESLILQAVDHLKPVIKEKISRSRILI